MSDDLRNDPSFREWEAEVLEGLVPKLSGSAATISLVPRGETDIKFALELGLSIMMDKPILAIVHPGTKVSQRLLRVADQIVEVDLDDPDARSTVPKAIETFMRDVVGE